MDAWRDSLHAPLRIPIVEVHRPYLGGDLRRRFRGRESSGNDNWTDEWIGSDIPTSNPLPDGGIQGFTNVQDPAGHEARLADLLEAFPETMLGTASVEQRGPRLGFLVKLISLGSTGPVHTHPSAGFAAAHLGSSHGQAETWIPLETRTADDEPLQAGIGFVPGATRSDLVSAIENRSAAEMRELLNPTTVAPGEAWLIRPGLPHYIGAEVFFIEIQQPSDVSILSEHWSLGADEMGATAGLGWDVGLAAFDFGADDDARPAVVDEARQGPQVLFERGQTREVRLIEEDPLAPFDVRRLEVEDELMIGAGRLSIVVVTAGSGAIEGEWGSLPVTRGDALAIPAALAHRFQADDERLTVHRCMGPAPAAART